VGSCGEPLPTLAATRTNSKPPRSRAAFPSVRFGLRANRFRLFALAREKANHGNAAFHFFYALTRPDFGPTWPEVEGTENLLFHGCFERPFML